MSPLEESAKVAQGFVEAMRSQPLSLALVVMNFSLLGLLYMQSVQFHTQRKESIALVIETHRESQKLISQCVVPGVK